MYCFSLSNIFGGFLLYFIYCILLLTVLLEDKHTPLYLIFVTSTVTSHSCFLWTFMCTYLNKNHILRKKKKKLKPKSCMQKKWLLIHPAFHNTSLGWSIFSICHSCATVGCLVPCSVDPSCSACITTATTKSKLFKSLHPEFNQLLKWFLGDIAFVKPVLFNYVSKPSVIITFRYQGWFKSDWLL